MKKLVFLLSTVTVLLSSCNTETVELAGAGATFPVPYYNVAFEAYKAQTGNIVSYGGIGSGGGIRSITEGIVDFAGTDAFLNDERMAEITAKLTEAQKVEIREKTETGNTHTHTHV